MRLTPLILSLVCGSLLLAFDDVEAQLAIEGTPVTTAELASGTTQIHNLPAGITSGELVLCLYRILEDAKNLELTDWTHETIDVGAEAIGVIYTTTVGGLGATVTFNVNIGSSGSGSTCFRVSGYDSGDPIGVSTGGTNASEDPFVLAANTLTGMTSGNWALLSFGTEQADRTVTTGDGDTTLISNVTGGASGFSHHTYYEDLAGTGNSAYSFDMSSARDWRWAIFELNEDAPSGPTHIHTMQNPGKTVGPHKSQQLGGVIDQ